jgi:putative salt-induced outer membrane protein YdiY
VAPILTPRRIRRAARSAVHSGAEAALSTRINGAMQMKAAFVARNDTNVSIGKNNTDTQTSLTMVYSF